MNDINPVDQKDLAQANEKLILSVLRRQGPMSQKQLRDITGLSTSTSS